MTAYVTESGQLAAWYAYDGFGNTIDSYATTTHFSFRFSPKYLDTETGMYYYGRRFYLPHLGRWLNRDPIEEDGGENLYAFCKNNGLMYFDYLGMDFWGYFFDAVNVVAGSLTAYVGGTMVVGAGWTGVGAVAGAYIFAMGADQAAYGAINICNRLQNKAVKTGSPIQRIYRNAAERITGKENSGLEKTLDTFYFGSQVLAACATGTISVKASVTSVKSIGVAHTAKRLVSSTDGFVTSFI